MLILIILETWSQDIPEQDTSSLLTMQSSTCFSKKQGSIETSTFGSKFVALKTAMEANRGMRYKLQIMRATIDRPSYVFCNNPSVIANSSQLESLLKKKSNAIAYHAVREACATKEILICHVPTDDNVADLLTKVLPSGEIRGTVTYT
jgi:hypothetical protein